VKPGLSRFREEHRLRVFENRVLRRISGSKGDEATGTWRKLNHEQLQSLFSTLNIIRTSRQGGWAGHVARRGHEKCVQSCVCKVLREEITPMT
jgi:hypothetical protein